MSEQRSGGTSQRHRAREFLFRVVYQADLGGETVAESWGRQSETKRLSDDQRELVEDVVRVLAANAQRVDEALAAAAAHWPLDRMSATDRSVLRAAVAELMARSGTPARVVLDEAIEIAKRYGSDESGKFVNGVLDRVARELRPEEFA